MVNVGTGGSVGGPWEGNWSVGSESPWPFVYSFIYSVTLGIQDYFLLVSGGQHGGDMYVIDAGTHGAELSGRH